jgi:hypothetical protein
MVEEPTTKDKPTMPAIKASVWEKKLTARPARRPLVVYIVSTSV